MNKQATIQLPHDSTPHSTIHLIELCVRGSLLLIQHSCYDTNTVVITVSPSIQLMEGLRPLLGMGGSPPKVSK